MAKAKQADYRKVTPWPIVLAFGAEDYLVSRTVRSVRDQLRALNSDLEVHDIEAADYAAGQLFDLTSPSLFAEPKLLIIRSAERCTDELITDAIEYLEKPSSDATVIITHSASTVRGKKMLDAMRLSSKVCEVPCAKLKGDQDRAAFVTAEFTAAGRQVSQSAVRALLDAFSDNLGELAAACAQLSQDSSANITEELVDTYYGGRVETTSWKIGDAALAGRPAEALSLLRHALASGQDPVPIISALSKSIRELAKLFGNRTATAASLGMEPWRLEKTRKNLAGWSEDGLAAAVNAMAEADAAAKGANRDPNYVIERLILLIAAKGVA
jgi:DNA polymerase-3 subunit delta